jgi:hypothetical protein
LRHRESGQLDHLRDLFVERHLLKQFVGARADFGTFDGVVSAGVTGVCRRVLLRARRRRAGEYQRQREAYTMKSGRATYFAYGQTVAMRDHEVPLELGKRVRLYTHSGGSNIGKSVEAARRFMR